MFLETITSLDNIALIPINRIKYIYYICEESFKIHVVTDDFKCSEYFKNKRVLLERWKEIKELLAMSAKK